jgi:two-component system response regulator DctR
VLCRLVSRQKGYTVVGAAVSAAQARVMVANLRPDLALVDIGLGGENGVELVRQLRTASVPVEVIAVTADSSSETVRGMLQLGAVDYLVKPFRPERLTRALGRFQHHMNVLSGSRVSQSEVDRLRQSTRMLPRDISEDRLDEVRMVLLDATEPLTAEEVGARAFMSRVTARRYLELLVTLGETDVTTVVDGPGRPRKAYEIVDVSIADGP